ncbi:unnamed protein product, partial [Phaeothamnion confervicola]
GTPPQTRRTGSWRRHAACRGWGISLVPPGIAPPATTCGTRRGGTGSHHWQRSSISGRRSSGRLGRLFLGWWHPARCCSSGRHRTASGGAAAAAAARRRGISCAAVSLRTLSGIRRLQR